MLTGSSRTHDEIDCTFLEEQVTFDLELEVPMGRSRGALIAGGAVRSPSESGIPHTNRLRVCGGRQSLNLDLALEFRVSVQELGLRMTKNSVRIIFFSVSCNRRGATESNLVQECV